MNTSIVFTRQIDSKNIAIKPVFNYQKANKYFSKFEKHYQQNSNYEAYKNLEQALLNRPAYHEYLLNKSYLLQRLGYTNEAFKLYRNAIKNKKTNRTMYTTSAYVKKRQNHEYYTGFDNDTEILMLKKSPKTHRKRKFIATACLSILLSISAQVVKSQDIEGYVRNTSGNALENVRIEAIYQNDTTQRKSTTSDYSGFYQLNDIITSDNQITGFENDEINFFYDGKNLSIDIKSRHKIQYGRLFTLNGQTVAASEFTQTGTNEYKSEINMAGISEKMILFSDEVHPAKKLILSMLPLNGTETFYYSTNEKDKNKSLKSEKSDINTFIFRLDDPENVDTYQSLETTKDIDMLNQNNIDFEMTPWPEYYADLQVYVCNYEQAAMQGVDIALVDIESGQTYNTTSNNTGNASINNIFIPAFTQNRLLADTINLKLTLNLIDYREIIDTLYLTEASYDTSYVFYPTSWKAILNVNVKDALTKENKEGVSLELWEEGNYPGTNGTTNVNGNKTFEETIPDYDATRPDTINYVLRVNGSEQTLEETLKLTQGQFSKEYLTGKNYGLVINSTDGTNDLATVNWLLLDLNDTTQVIGSGNTGANAVDTLKFFSELPSLDVILKTDIENHDSSRVVLNMLQNEFTTQSTTNNPSTPEESVAYLARKFVSEISNNPQANIVLSNEELNFRDTLFNIQEAVWWQDTVPVNPTGTTNYNMKIIPSTSESQIPAHVLEKILFLQPEQELVGRDTLSAMEQKQKLKGWVKRLQDKQLTSLMDIIIKSYDGSFTDSIRSTNGQFETKPLPVDVEGEGFEGYIIVKPLGVDSTDHLGLYKIPITTKEMTSSDIATLESEGDTRYHGRPIVIPEKLTNFADSTKQVNFMLTPKELTDPYTGAKLKTNPYHIWWMEGEPIDSERSRYGQWNVWIDPTMNMTDYENFLTHIRTLFGKPFNENRVSEKFLFNNLEVYSLQNDNNKDKLGWNIAPAANATTPRAPPTVEGLSLIIGGDMGLSLSNITGAIREYIIRTVAINVFSSGIRESLANTSIPYDFPDTANIEDRCYIPLFMDHRKEQVKSSLLERTHNNLGYLRDVKNFYNEKTLEEMYGSKK